MGCNCVKAEKPKRVDIRSVYTLGDVLGTGAFGQVRACLHKATQQPYAVKIMSKQRPAKNRKIHNVDYVLMFKNEIETLGHLDHRNIIRFFEFFEDNHFLYAVMDRCEGGELYQRITKKKAAYESDMAWICRQMLLSVEYLHRRSIVHRDIKAQNFLFRDQSENSDLVLIDFGMATTLHEDNQFLNRLCGSPHYVSPELVQKHYRFSVDIWAVGVVLYLMAYGKYPFEGSDRNSIMRKVGTLKPNFEKGPSPGLLDFLKHLLKRNPAKRYTAAEALSHEFLRADAASRNSVVVPREIVKQFERKITQERDLDGERLFDRKLSQMDELYRKKTSSGLRTVADMTKQVRSKWHDDSDDGERSHSSSMAASNGEQHRDECESRNPSSSDSNEICELASVQGTQSPTYEAATETADEEDNEPNETTSRDEDEEQEWQ